MKKIYIVATGSSRKKMDWNADGDIWVPGSMLSHDDCKRCDLVFELHDFDIIKNTVNMLNESNATVFMKELQPEVLKSVKFPIDEITKEFGFYFTNTISYMLAHAIIKKYEEINLYGVHMIDDSEYGHQKPSCEYFIGLARGRGITVNIAEGSELLYCPELYGYEKQSELRSTIKMKMDLYTLNVESFRKKYSDFKIALEQTTGAIKILDIMIKKNNDIENKTKNEIIKYFTDTKHTYEKLKAEFENEIKVNETSIHQSMGAITAMKYLVKCGY